MAASKLVSVLEIICSCPTPHVRKEAEAFLTARQAAGSWPQLVADLADIVLVAPSTAELCFAATVAIRDTVKKQWSVRSVPPVPESVKNDLRHRIRTAFSSVNVFSTPRMVSLWGEVIALVASADFPKYWPTLVSDLGHAVSAAKAQAMPCVAALTTAAAATASVPVDLEQSPSVLPLLTSLLHALHSVLKALSAKRGATQPLVLAAFSPNLATECVAWANQWAEVLERAPRDTCHVRRGRLTGRSGAFPSLVAYQHVTHQFILVTKILLRCVVMVSANVGILPHVVALQCRLWSTWRQRNPTAQPRRPGHTSDGPGDFEGGDAVAVDRGEAAFVDVILRPIERLQKIMTAAFTKHPEKVAGFILSQSHAAAAAIANPAHWFFADWQLSTVDMLALNASSACSARTFGFISGLLQLRASNPQIANVCQALFAPSERIPNPLHGWLDLLLTVYFAEDTTSAETMELWRADPATYVIETDVETSPDDPVHAAVACYLDLTSEGGVVARREAWELISQRLTRSDATTPQGVESLCTGLRALAEGYNTLLGPEGSEERSRAEQHVVGLFTSAMFPTIERYLAHQSAPTEAHVNRPLDLWLSTQLARRVVHTMGMWCDSIASVELRAMVHRSLVAVMKCPAVQPVVLVTAIRTAQQYVSSNYFTIAELTPDALDAEMKATAVATTFLGNGHPKMIQELAGFAYVLLEKAGYTAGIAGRGALTLFAPCLRHLMSAAQQVVEKDDTYGEDGATPQAAAARVILEVLATAVLLTAEGDAPFCFDATWDMTTAFICPPPRSPFVDWAGDEAWAVALNVARMLPSGTTTRLDEGTRAPWTLDDAAVRSMHRVASQVIAFASHHFKTRIAFEALSTCVRCLATAVLWLSDDHVLAAISTSFGPDGLMQFFTSEFPPLVRRVSDYFCASSSSSERRTLHAPATASHGTDAPRNNEDDDAEGGDDDFDHPAGDGDDDALASAHWCLWEALLILWDRGYVLFGSSAGSGGRTGEADQAVVAGVTTVALHLSSMAGGDAVNGVYPAAALSRVLLLLLTASQRGMPSDRYHAVGQQLCDVRNAQSALCWARCIDAAINALDYAKAPYLAQLAICGFGRITAFSQEQGSPLPDSAAALPALIEGASTLTTAHRECYGEDAAMDEGRTDVPTHGEDPSNTYAEAWCDEGALHTTVPHRQRLKRQWASDGVAWRSSVFQW